MKRFMFSEEQIIGILKEHQAGISAKELCRRKDRGFVKDNPALGISNIRRKRGEPRSNRPWQDSERDAVLDAVPKHMRPAIALMMFTGLGPQDALTLHRDAIEGDFIDTARSKTGVELYLPIISLSGRL